MQWAPRISTWPCVAHKKLCHIGTFLNSGSTIVFFSSLRSPAFRAAELTYATVNTRRLLLLLLLLLLALCCHGDGSNSFSRARSQADDSLGPSLSPSLPSPVIRRTLDVDYLALSPCFASFIFHHDLPFFSVMRR